MVVAKALPRTLRKVSTCMAQTNEMMMLTMAFADCGSRAAIVTSTISPRTTI